MDSGFIALHLSKILVTIATVLGLAWIAERVSTKAAGILAGFPLGTAIALVYFGIEQDANFAAQSAGHALLGFVATQAMTTVYWACLRFHRHLIIAPIAGVTAFVLSNGLLSLATGGLLNNLLIAVLATIGFGLCYRLIPAQNIQQAIKLSTMAVVVRGLISAVCVVLVTMVAYLGSSTLAGLFAAFPITFFPLLFIIHFSYGKQPVYTLIKYYPLGLGSLITHCLVVALTYGRWGVTAGTLAGLLSATLYLLIYQQIRKFWPPAQQKTT